MWISWEATSQGSTVRARYDGKADRSLEVNPRILGKHLGKAASGLSMGVLAWRHRGCWEESEKDD